METCNKHVPDMFAICLRYIRDETGQLLTKEKRKQLFQRPWTACAKKSYVGI